MNNPSISGYQSFDTELIVPHMDYEGEEVQIIHMSVAGVESPKKSKILVTLSDDLSFALTINGDTLSSVMNSISVNVNMKHKWNSWQRFIANPNQFLVYIYDNELKEYVVYGTDTPIPHLSKIKIIEKADHRFNTYNDETMDTFRKDDPLADSSLTGPTFDWTEEQTIKFLDLCKIYSKELVPKVNVLEVKPIVWEELAKQLNEKELFCFELEPLMCRNHFSTLRHTFTKMLSFSKLKDESRWLYFELMNEIIGEKPVEIQSKDKTRAEVPLRSRMGSNQGIAQPIRPSLMARPSPYRLVPTINKVNHKDRSQK